MSTEKEKRPHYRANLQAVMKTIRGLNLLPHHIIELKRTPFWRLIEAILYYPVEYAHCKRDDDLITKIICYFEKPSLKIMFEDHEMQIDEMDVRLIFGIKDGDKKLELYPENFMKTPFLERCFPDRVGKSQDRLGKPLIRQRLVQASQRSETTDAQDVARLLTVYILATLLIPSKNTSVPWTLTTIVNDLDAICDHNWSGLVIDTLITSVKGGKAANHSGCVVLLPYWLCEHTKLADPIRTEIFPRFLKWNLQQFQEIMLPRDLKNLNDDLIVRGSLKASEREKALLKINTTPNLLNEEPPSLAIEGGSLEASESEKALLKINTTPNLLNEEPPSLEIEGGSLKASESEKALLKINTTPNLLNEEPPSLAIEGVQPEYTESSTKDIGRRGKRVLDILFNVPPEKKSRRKKYSSQQTGSPAEVKNDNIPEWAQVLESVRELVNKNPTDWVRTKVKEALEKTPPDWAKLILENLINKAVYKDSNLGPTKELIISVLSIVRCERVLHGPARALSSQGVLSDLDAAARPRDDNAVVLSSADMPIPEDFICSSDQIIS